MAVIGSVAVEVLPSAKNFVRDLKAQIEPQLAAASRQLEVTVGVDLDTAKARAELETFGRTAGRSGGKTSGDEFSGAFERSLRSALTKAANALPVIKPDVDATPARLKLEQLRATLIGLNDEGLHLNPDQAMREIAEVRAALEVLQHSGDIDVRVDAHTAHSELTRLESEVKKLGGSAATTATEAGGAVSKFQVLGAVAVGALSLVGPLAAASAAAVTGLAGAAGVAFLAFKGLPDQLKSGSVAAVDFNTNVASIQNTFTRLEETAAKAVLPGVAAALGKVADALPSLNGLVGELGADLGSAAEHLSGALVGGLKTASPLMQSFGKYIDQGAAALERFSTSGEFKQFVAYANRELPKVGEFLLHAAEAGKDLVVALQPLGDSLLRGADSAAKLISALSKAPAQANEKSGGLLGGLVHVLTTDPRDLLGGGNPNEKADNEKRAKAAADAAAALAARQKANTEATAAAAATTDKQAALLGVTSGQYAAAEKSVAAFGTSTAATTLQMQLQNNALGLLNQALDTNAGKQLGVAEATTRLGAANQTTLAALKANGDTVDANTEKGNANRSAIEGSIEALRAQSQANAGAGKSTAEVTAQYNTNKDTLLKQIAATYGANSAVYAYAESLSAIPPVVKTELELKHDAATAALSVITTQLTGLDGKVVTATVRVNDQTGSVASFANGILVGGGRAATNAEGGYIAGPGTGTSDSIPRWLSNGEYVVNAAATAQNRALLEQINNGRKFASGGLVTSAPPRQYGNSDSGPAVQVTAVQQPGQDTAVFADLVAARIDFGMKVAGW